jgi:hypothetical protein
MFKIIDLSGQIFGRLTVVEFSRRENNISYWKCICSCNSDNIIERDWNQLKRNKYPSCGCWSREMWIESRANGKRKHNKYKLYENYVVGYVDNDIKFLIDLDDYKLIKKYYWNIDPKGYIKGCMNSKSIFLHRFIMNCPQDLVVDHIDRNPLNNKKENLRIVVRRENTRNKNKLSGTTSKYIGVYQEKTTGKWRAQIHFDDGRQVKLGTFEYEKDAALAYNKKAIELGYLTRNIIE